MTTYKNRTIDPTKPVIVYRNLTRACYSIKQGKYVVGHAVRVCLRDCRMHVSESGRQRVIAKKRKQVHAWIEGFVGEQSKGASHRLRYNPYFTSTFVDEKGQAVFTTPHVELNEYGCFMEGESSGQKLAS